MKLLSEDGASVVLIPTGYQFGRGAAPPGEWDANWLLVRGEVRTSTGESWTFDDPCLTTWDCVELHGWLRAASRGEVAPTDTPTEDDGLLWFTEPNVAFSIAETSGQTLVLRVHLSLESAPGRPDVDPGPPLDLYEYVVPLRVLRAELRDAADEWQTDIAPYPAR